MLVAAAAGFAEERTRAALLCLPSRKPFGPRMPAIAYIDTPMASGICGRLQELAYLAGGLSLESMRRKTVDIPAVYPEVVPGVQATSSQPQQPPLDASLLPAVMSEDPAMVYAAKKSLGGEHAHGVKQQAVRPSPLSLGELRHSSQLELERLARQAHALLILPWRSPC